MKITVPELSLILLVGPSGCGKSTLALQHFKPTEVLSSDYCRGLVSDDENDQASTKEAFEVLHFIARKRLAAGRLTVVDATNVQPDSRKPLIALAREFHVLPIAIVLDFPERLCQDRNRSRANRDFGPHVVRNQSQQLRRSLRGLEREGFRGVHIFKSPEELDGLEIERQPMWTNRRSEHGPFDIIGDVHGCFDELQELLTTLGYVLEKNGSGFRLRPPDGRKAIFVGDLVDRGPKIPDVLKLVMAMVDEGTALCVPGNHDMKLLQKLRGKDVKMAHGLADSVAQLDSEPPEFRSKVAQFLDSLISHYVLDEGKLVVAHAGMKEEMQGRGSGAVRSFALFGETTGETDEFGLPVRYNWAADYRGKASVVYGHTPIAEPQWLNRTVNIDTGCVFGGKLTALRYPEKEFVSVQSYRTYYEPVKPFISPEPAPALSQQHEQDDVLDIDDVIGKRIIETRLHGNLTIREPVPAHYDPGKPSRSVLLESDIQALQQARAPAEGTETAEAVLIPDWIKRVLWLFVGIAAIGLGLTLWVHIGAVMGKRVAPEPWFWMLHVGIFIVWFPAVFVAQRLVGSVNRKDFWKVVLKNCPNWMRYMIYGFGGYAMINSLLFMAKASTGGSGAVPTSDWRGFSGTWMIFY